MLPTNTTPVLLIKPDAPIELYKAPSKKRKKEEKEKN
jgi:hypothetical protein